MESNINLFQQYYKSQEYFDIIKQAYSKYPFIEDIDGMGIVACWKAAVSFDPNYKSASFLHYFRKCLFNDIKTELRIRQKHDNIKKRLALSQKKEYNTLNVEAVDTDYLDCLKESEKQLLQERYCENYTLQELGTKYQISCEAIRKKINRIIKKVRKFNLDIGVCIS